MRCSGCSDELDATAEEVIGIGGHPVCERCAEDEACAAAVLTAPPTEARSTGAACTVWVVTVEIDAAAVFEVHVFSSFAIAKQAAAGLALAELDEEEAVDRTDVDACIEAAQAYGAVITLHERVVRTVFVPAEEGER